MINRNEPADRKIPLHISQKLDASTYFQEIIKEGARLSLIPSETLEKLQSQILTLLSAAFNRYTGGFSSSVPLETGQRIQQSIFFTTGYYLKRLSSPEEAFILLETCTLDELYQKGKKRIAEDFLNTKALLASIQKKLPSFDVLAYNDTLKEGIPLFFAAYDADYGAHEIPGSIDYPLSNDPMILTGLEYIMDYLRKFQLENLFCSYYPSETVLALIRGSDPMYREQLFNIFDLVLANSLASALMGRSALNLYISDYDQRFLQYELGSQSRDQIELLADQAGCRMCVELSIAGTNLEHYIRASIRKLKGRLWHAVHTDSLPLLFPSSKDEDELNTILFRDKDHMDHAVLRALYNEILSCRHLSDKLILLRNAPLSMRDLTDLLDSECFFEDEYASLFSSLNEVELALLLKTLPHSADLPSLYGRAAIRDEYEKLRQWHLPFLSYLDGLELKDRNRIEAFSERLEISQVL
ncbi:MAG: hypothetical protein K0R19_1895 [Bacillota bacterium]|nr:hypothetical protein [Bacillota bacterium]